MKGLIKNLRLMRSAGLSLRYSAAISMIKPMKASNSWQRSYLTTELKNWMSTRSFHRKNAIKFSYQGDGFYIEQMLAGCLAIYSYYIESGDECFLIDPLFDTFQYNELIKARGKKLKGIFSTHYRADYVSGQYDIQKQHKCSIYMGPKAAPGEGLVVLEDKAKIKVGDVTLECWHTPGRTEESSCIVLIDKNGKVEAVFSGQTVFLNEVGCPDLAVEANLTPQNLAELLFDSIKKIKTLDDNTRIYPGHGSGSSQGKCVGEGDFSTVGTQKQNNQAFKVNDKAEFVKNILADMSEPPSQFGYNANLDKMEPFSPQEAAKKVLKELNPQQVYDLSKQGDVIILDVRSTEELKAGVIENSICVGFDGAFSTWVGTLLSPTDKFVIYGSNQQAKQTVTRLFKIGYINILGHSNFSIDTWKEQGFPVYVPEMVDEAIQPGCTVLDIRKPGEWKDGVVEGATLLELTDVVNHPQKLDISKEYVIHCRSGYRAKIAWSFMLSSGFKAKCYPHSFDSIFKSGRAKLVKP